MEQCDGPRLAMGEVDGVDERSSGWAKTSTTLTGGQPVSIVLAAAITDSL
ncbi:hypothetical protein PO002_40390 [Cupriavidus necator]